MNETLEAVRQIGGEAIAVPTDLPRQDGLVNLVRSTVDAFGGVDIFEQQRRRDPW